MKLLFLHSDKASNNVFTLDKRIEGEYRFVSFVATNNIYNVTDKNNKIYWNENGTDLTTTLTNGYYDTIDLTTHLSTMLNGSATGIVSVSFNENTRKFTVTDTLNFYFTFQSNTNNSARKLLGFTATDGTNALSQTSDTVVDINSYKNVFITIKQDNHKNIEGVDFFNGSLMVNSTAVFGDTLRYIEQDNFCQYIKLRNTKQLEISFHDANNNNIDLNSEYQVILLKV